MTRTAALVPGVAARRPWPVRISLVLLVAAAAMLAGRTAAYLAMAQTAVRFPFELDYGEGIVWQQLRLIMAGRGYGPIAGLPSIVFHYPPLYHVVTAAVAAVTGADQLLAGRAVSFAATLATAGLIAVLTARLADDNGPRLPVRSGAVLAATVALAMLPTELWSVLMRVDMLCMALTFGGLLCGMAALTRPRAIYGAALLFVAAIYTKQTALAAPAAVFTTLLLARPRTALAGIAATLGLGLVVLAALTWTTHGGFLRHIVLYNINRVDLTRLELIRDDVSWHYAFIFCGIIGARQEIQRVRGACTRQTAPSLRGLLAADPRTARAAMALLHLAGATLMLALLAKSGAAENYLIEWNCLIALFTGLALRDIGTNLVGPPGRPSRETVALALLVPGVLLSQLLLHPRPDLWSAAALRSQTAPASRLVSAIAAAPQPVISDNMVALLRAGRTVVVEPAIATELAAKGVWNEARLVAALRQRRFAFVVTSDAPGTVLFDRRHSPAVAAAMQSSYPVTEPLGSYYVHRPAASPR